MPGNFRSPSSRPSATRRRPSSACARASSNKSDLGGVLQANNIHIAVAASGEVTTTLAALKASPATARAKAKFVLATDGESFEAEDIISGETLACAYADFPNHFGFFLALAGITTVKPVRESSFDIRATSRLNRLYVELLKDNPEWGTAERRHDMNHFMARLIFCFFSEDTDIFNGTGLFTATIDQMSARDSSNTHEVIGVLFRAMNTRIEERATAKLPRWADEFPYVNGGLFSGSMEVPRFSKIARSYLIHIGNLDWTKINPDIFGSMIQAVAEDEERGALGMHYTSVPNILKVLNPLFLDELRERLEEADDNARKLLNLRNRMSRIRVFDPACGSGNFLVIAYKEMRAIEAEINRRRGEADRRTEIPVTNFRGIELRLARLRGIRKYVYRMDILERALSYDEVTEIFVRVNSLGAKLRSSDLALAQITAKWRGSLKTFQAFQEQCTKRGFDLDLGIHLKNLVAFGTGQSRFLTVGKLPIDTLRRAWNECVAGMEFALNFLKSNVKIDSPILLSSPFLLVALAFYGHKRNYQIETAEAQRLRQWALTANAKGRYSRGSSETLLDQDLATLREGGGAKQLIERLRLQVGRLDVAPEEFEGRNQRSALFKTMFLAFRDAGARDWRSNLAIALDHYGTQHRLQFHHIFPKAVLKTSHTSRETEDIANLAFIGGKTNRRISDKPPSLYFPDLINTSGISVFEAQCIPTDQSLLGTEAYGRFLAERRKLMSERVNSFLGLG